MMAPFIAKAIMKQADISETKGQAKYRAYFIKTRIYSKWQDDVDTILETEGYENCIVSA